MADIIGLGEALKSKVAEKLYDDALSKAAKQFGEFGENFIKAARFVFFPIQIFAVMQDRLEKTLERVCNEVPSERRITPPPLQIIGPIFENMKYMDDKSILYELFQKLMSSSIDYKLINEVHPAFVHIITQLAHDEAIILLELNKNDFEIVYTMDLNHEKERFENRIVEKSTIPKENLDFAERVDDEYYSHLESLSLIKWPVIKTEYLWDDKGKQTGIRHHSKMHLTEFGKSFVNACVPEEGFRNK